MWVCDARYGYQVKGRYQRSYNGGTTWVTEETWYETPVCYNYFNWGWDGLCNGYFVDLTFWAYAGCEGMEGYRDYARNVKCIVMSLD